MQLHFARLEPLHLHFLCAFDRCILIRARFSLKAIATACFTLLTFFPAEVLSFPAPYSRITCANFAFGFMSSSTVYATVPLAEIERYEKLAKRMEVSEVARSSRGFLTALRYYGWRRLPVKWIRKRNAFIARHLAQHREQPTMRRWLALMMWGFKAKLPPN